MTKPCKRPFRWPKRRKFTVTYTCPHIFTKDHVVVLTYWAEAKWKAIQDTRENRLWWGLQGYGSVIKQVTL